MIRYSQLLILVFSAIAVAGLVRVRRQRGALLCAIGLLGLFGISWPPIDWLLSRHLERWYPPGPVDTDSVGAIVVLSSGTLAPVETRPYPILDEETYVRCDYAAYSGEGERHSGGKANGIPG